MLEWLKFWNRGGSKSIGGAGWQTIFSQGNADLASDKESGDPRDTYMTWVAKCVKTNADVFAATDMPLYKTDNTGKETLVRKHAVLDLLNDVNPYITRYELMWRLAAHLELWGNEYWFTTNNKLGEPFEIIPLQPSRTKPIPDTKFYVKGYEFQPDEGDPIIIPVDNIIHFRNYNPFSDIIGMSTIEHSRNLIYTDKYASLWNKNFFRNSAIPGVVITTPNSLTKPDIRRIRDSWVQEYGGPNRSGKPAVMHSGADIKVIQSTMADMQMIELRTKNRDDIMRMFGVPSVLLGDLDKVTYASAKTAEYIHDKMTNYPRCKQVANVLNEFLLTRFRGTDNMFFKRVEPQLLDTDTDNRLEKQFTNKIITVNEWRSAVGRSPLPDGDRYKEDAPLPMLQVPAQQDKEDPEDKEKTKQIQGLVEKSMKKNKEMAVRAPIVVDDVVAENIVETDTVPSPIPYVEGANPLHPGYSKQKQNHWLSIKFEEFGMEESSKKRVREDGNILTIKDALVSLFAKQMDRALKEVDSGMKALKPSSILDPKKELKATIDILMPLIGAVLSQEARDALTKIDADPNAWTLESPTAKDYLKNGMARLATSMTETTVNGIRTAIAEGLDAGEGIVEMTARIKSLGIFGESRAETIALTETHRASAYAELEAFKASKVVASKIWYTAEDERTCPLCAPMHGVEVPLNAPFLTLSEMEGISVPNYDGSIKTPMMHPRCRCVMIPVLKA